MMGNIREASTTMRRPRGGPIPSALLAAGLLGTGLAASPAMAADGAAAADPDERLVAQAGAGKTVTFDIPAQALDSALTTLADQR